MTQTVGRYLHLSHADAEVGLIELIRDVPAKWSKLTAFLHKCMEEAQTKEHLMPAMRLQNNDELASNYIIASCLHAGVAETWAETDQND